MVVVTEVLVEPVCLDIWGGEDGVAQVFFKLACLDGFGEELGVAEVVSEVLDEPVYLDI